jgi:raffinose/stachyose/melibiose transport system permease protein
MSDPAALRPGPASCGGVPGSGSALGGPANASQTMLTYLYFNGAERTQFGYGATVSVVLFGISFAFALVYQRYALRRDTAGAVTRAVG